MKRFKGILGASLAGFAALTMAAITATATTEAIAFKGSRVRVQAPTQMRPASNVQRRIPRAQSPTHVGRTMSEFNARRLSVPTAVKRNPASNAATGTALIQSFHQPRPQADGNLAERYQDPTPQRRKRITNKVEGKPSMMPVGSSQASTKELRRAVSTAKKLRDPRLDHLKKNFFEAIQGPQFTPIPEEIANLGDPAKNPGECTWFWDLDDETRSDWIAAGALDGNGPAQDAVNDQFGVCNGPYVDDDMDFTDGTEDDVDMDFTEDGNGEVDYDFTEGSTEDSTENSDDSGGALGHESSHVEDVDMDFTDDDAGSDDPEGDGGPAEIGGALRDKIQDVAGFQEAAMADGSPASAAANQSGTPSATGGKCGLEIARDGVDGRNRNPEDGNDPAASPAVSAAMGININTSHALSPSVDGDGKSNPPGPIGPVATESASASVDMGASLSAAMSDPMSDAMAPAVGGDGKDNPPGPIEPVADHSRVRDHIR